MGNIFVLDETTANQIAAGEVVERPVSVVKELVENSLDAGASRITVELTQGGLTGIKVIDNGCGMSAGDAEICFQRHATSKIRWAEDLNKIHTLGFRGEALPSIASVARVTLTTRTAADLAGTMVYIEAGQIKEIASAGCPVGTAIEVKELFFNTPARRKFLKSANAETGQVSDLISRLAMAKPDVRFELRSGGKVLFFSPGNGSLKDTAAVIFGADNVRSMLEVNFQGNFLSIAGLISKPVLTRASRQYQNFFINGRYIRSGLISAVLQQAYQTQIPAGRFPIAILHLHLDPTQVDVNVHPTKMEVRLAKEKEVQEELLEALSKPLDLSGAITSLWEIMPGRGNAQSEEDRAGAGEARPLVNPEVPESGEPVPEQLLDSTEDKGKQPSPPAQNKEQLRFSLPAQTMNASQPAEPPRVVATSKDRTTPIETLREPRVYENKIDYQPEAFFPTLSPAGQVPPTYVLAYGEGGLYIIDQHAAHERVLYEKYLAMLQQDVPSQMLLEPVALEIPHHEAQLLVQHIVDFHDGGFILEHFGGDTFLLRGVPAQAATAPGEIFMDLLARLQENPSCRLDRGLVMDQLAAAMACRDAVKAGKHLGGLEVKALLEGLARCQRPYTCPHGRPTLIQIPHEELNKRFKR